MEGNKTDITDITSGNSDICFQFGGFPRFVLYVRPAEMVTIWHLSLKEIVPLSMLCTSL